jgi:PAS domain S-box-containing protein
MQQRQDDSSPQPVTVEEQTGQTRSTPSVQVPTQHILTLIDSLSEGIFVLDKEWRYIYLNRLAEELVGRSREELLGKNVWELFPEAVDTMIYTESRKAVQEQQAQQFEVFYPPLNKWFESKIYPTPEGLTVFSRDITERKQAEVDLARYAAIITSSDDAIVSKTLDGIITSWNTAAERMFGYTAAEAIGQPITLIIPAELQREEVDILEKIRRGVPIQHYETVRESKNGTKVAVSLSISPVKDSTGKIIGAAKIARDISERLELERRKDVFIGVAGHELKTPITSLKGFIQLLRRKFEQQGVQEAVPLLTRMEAQVERLTKLIDELLDVSKIQAGRVAYEEETVDLAVLLQETVELLQASSPAHTLLVTGTPHAWIMGDKDHLSQMLTNLITNAIKYSPQATKVDLSLTASRTTVTLRVRDYGIGIPKAYQKHIFDRFYRAPERQQEFSGLGLGLYITHEIVKRHGGEITLESEEGKGSTFIVSLPLKKNEWRRHRKRVQRSNDSEYPHLLAPEEHTLSSNEK